MNPLNTAGLAGSVIVGAKVTGGASAIAAPVLKEPDAVYS